MQLFDTQQSSILVIYFVYFYLAYSYYTNINTMSIARYTSKKIFITDFISEQGIFCFAYLLILTVIGTLFLFKTVEHKMTLTDIVIFFLISYINLLIMSYLTLILRLLYGTVPAFLISGTYVGISAISSFFFNTPFTGFANPFILIFAYKTPFNIGIGIGYAFLIIVAIILSIKFKTKDLKI